MRSRLRGRKDAVTPLLRRRLRLRLIDRLLCSAARLRRLRTRETSFVLCRPRQRRTSGRNPELRQQLPLWPLRWLLRRWLQLSRLRLRLPPSLDQEKVVRALALASTHGKRGLSLRFLLR